MVCGVSLLSKLRQLTCQYHWRNVKHCVLEFFNMCDKVIPVDSGWRVYFHHKKIQRSSHCYSSLTKIQKNREEEDGGRKHREGTKNLYMLINIALPFTFLLFQTCLECLPMTSLPHGSPLSIAYCGVEQN